MAGPAVDGRGRRWERREGDVEEWKVKPGCLLISASPAVGRGEEEALEAERAMGRSEAAQVKLAAGCRPPPPVLALDAARLRTPLRAPIAAGSAWQGRARRAGRRPAIAAALPCATRSRIGCVRAAMIGRTRRTRPEKGRDCQRRRAGSCAVQRLACLVISTQPAGPKLRYDTPQACCQSVRSREQQQRQPWQQPGCGKATGGVRRRRRALLPDVLSFLLQDSLHSCQKSVAQEQGDARERAWCTACGCNREQGQCCVTTAAACKCPRPPVACPSCCASMGACQHPAGQAPLPSAAPAMLEAPTAASTTRRCSRSSEPLPPHAPSPAAPSPAAAAWAHPWRSGWPGSSTGCVQGWLEVRDWLSAG